MKAGSQQGGTLITIEGQNLLSIKFCRFESGKMSEGDIVGIPLPNKIACRTGLASKLGPVLLQLSTDGVHWMSSGHRFEFYKKPSITQIDPLSGPTVCPFFMFYLPLTSLFFAGVVRLERQKSPLLVKILP